MVLIARGARRAARGGSVRVSPGVGCWRTTWLAGKSPGVPLLLEFEEYDQWAPL